MHTTSKCITLQFDAIDLLFARALRSDFKRPSATQTWAELLANTAWGADKGHFVPRSRHVGYEEVGVCILCHVSKYKLWVLSHSISQGVDGNLIALPRSPCVTKSGIDIPDCKTMFRATAVHYKGKRRTRRWRQANSSEIIRFTL